MSKLIITKGLPASGKTTWAKEYQSKNPNTVRVNKDDLRAMLHNSIHSKGREAFALSVRDFIVKKALSEGHEVIVDDTNLNPVHEQELRNIASIVSGNKTKTRVEVIIQDFANIPLSECIVRDKVREKSVGASVIRDMYRKYLQPIPKPFNEKLPYAIICDIDGTLALFRNENPYDRDFSKDDLNRPVAAVLDRFYNYKRILFSGRKGESKEVTKKWLEDMSIGFDELHMRSIGDTRRDFEVKKEMYEQFIQDKYNVLFVLDDRDQVVNLWRSLGLTCFQVADGDF